MDRNAYLTRLNYTGSLAPTRSTLRALQVAHLYAVPFENLDVALKRPITLDLDGHLRQGRPAAARRVLLRAERVVRLAAAATWASR